MATLAEDVTICAVDCVNPGLAARALDQSMAVCTFKKAILFSDTKVEGDFNFQKIEKLNSRDAYSHFMIKDMAQYIETEFVLVVQWDGYVLDPAAWSDSFFQYDYIGARWGFYDDGMTVGNGGFSLRSRKLVDAISGDGFVYHQGLNEDVAICRTNRRLLEESFDIRFAPEHVADAFSYECDAFGAPTFGFHGFFNMWRHVDDAEMVRILKAINPGFLKSHDMAHLLLTYFEHSHLKMVKTIFKLISRKFGKQIIQDNILKLTDHDFALCKSIMNIGASG